MNNNKKGRLFVVSTPIGNLEDLTIRARRTLSEADLVVCEDTRRTRKLLTHLELRKPMLSYHEHNEETRVPGLLDRLKGGQNLALISDAGTPLLSDPGYRLVRACRQENLPVTVVPGPCAAVAALSVSGLATDQFLFLGFLPSRKSERLRQMERLQDVDSTLIFFVSPHRLSTTLKEMLSVWGDRPAFLIKEMTKMHEEGYFSDLAHLAKRWADVKPQGEYTLLVAGSSEPPSAKGPTLDPLAYGVGLVQARGLSCKEAAHQVARELSLSRKTFYRELSDLIRKKDRGKSRQL